MTPDYRALCAELLEKIDYTWGDIPDDVLALMERARAALAQPEPAPVLTRPECFGFAMSFLGDPEEAEVRRYVEALEARPTIQPVANGEVAELVRWLLARADEHSEESDGLYTRTAKLLQHQRPQPKPAELTDEDVRKILMSHGILYQHQGYLLTAGNPGNPRSAKVSDIARVFRAVLTRYARSTIQPVPVSERLPGAEDCDAGGRCWWFVPEDDERPSGWYLDGQPPAREIRFYGNTHWLPHHALPTS